MTTCFVFSDEAGGYKERRDARYLQGHPYYVRSAIIISDKDWLKLKDRFLRLKEEYGLPIDKEIKWNYIWSLKQQRERREEISERKRYHFLRDVSTESLIAFVSDCCSLMRDCEYCRLIFTVTFNQTDLTIPKTMLDNWHLEELMPRIEMEMESKPDNLAILFFDSSNPRNDNALREQYKNTYYQGPFIERYKHIKDSCSFELSHHSFGIQMADYAAGIFNGSLRGFNTSLELFSKYLSDLIRRSEEGKVLGYGIREVPKDTVTRSILQSKLPFNSNP
jgi:hypothetical protein